MDNLAESWLEINMTSSGMIDDITTMVAEVDDGDQILLKVAEMLFIVIDPIITWGGIFFQHSLHPGSDAPVFIKLTCW